MKLTDFPRTMATTQTRLDLIGCHRDSAIQGEPLGRKSLYIFISLICGLNFCVEVGRVGGGGREGRVFVAQHKDLQLSDGVRNQQWPCWSWGVGHTVSRKQTTPLKAFRFGCHRNKNKRRTNAHTRIQWRHWLVREEAAQRCHWRKYFSRSAFKINKGKPKVITLRTCQI